MLAILGSLIAVSELCVLLFANRQSKQQLIIGTVNFNNSESIRTKKIPTFNVIIQYNESKYQIAQYDPNYFNLSKQYFPNMGYGDYLSLRYERTVIYGKIENVIATTENVYFINNTVYFPSPCNPRFWNGTNNESLQHLIQYNEVVLVGHQHTYDWGHWISEAYPCLFLIPREILERSFFAIPSYSQTILESLQILGVKRDQIISGENKAFFASTVYTVLAPSCGDMSPDLIHMMRAKVVDIFKLDRKEPTRYVLFNRLKAQPRTITNFEHLLHVLQDKYPAYKFEKGIFYSSFQKQVRYFNEMRLCFGVHGSVLINSIFMQHKTILMELQMETILPSIYLSSLYSGKRIFVARDEKISYRKIQRNNVNISYICDFFEFTLSKIDKEPTNYTGLV